MKGKSAVNPYAVGVYGVLRNFEKRYKLELITRRLQVQILSPQPKQIPLLIQSCRQRYRYFTAKNIDRISTYKNKRCILGVFHPSCNAFFVVFITLPRDLTQHSCRPIVKQPLFVKRLKYDHSLVCIIGVTSLNNILITVYILTSTSLPLLK